MHAALWLTVAGLGGRNDRIFKMLGSIERLYVLRNDSVGALYFCDVVDVITNSLWLVLFPCCLGRWSSEMIRCILENRFSGVSPCSVGRVRRERTNIDSIAIVSGVIWTTIVTR